MSRVTHHIAEQKKDSERLTYKVKLGRFIFATCLDRDDDAPGLRGFQFFFKPCMVTSLPILLDVHFSVVVLANCNDRLIAHKLMTVNNVAKAADLGAWGRKRYGIVYGFLCFRFLLLEIWEKPCKTVVWVNGSADYFVSPGCIVGWRTVPGESWAVRNP